MGFFNLFLFIIIFHVFVTTPIFSHSNNNNERSSSSISNFLDLAKSPEEMVEWEHKSKVDEKMHACAHDAHTAMLLGAAKILKQHEHQIKGTVVLVFQPAEEGGAGAKKVLEAGVLDKVSAIFGLHLVPTLPLGHVASKPGPFMAGSGTFHATIHGRGGHAAMPHLSIDPVLAASSAVVNLQQLVSREADPLDPQVVTVANFHGDGAFNVIPDSVTIGGTFRAFSPESITRLKERIQQSPEVFDWMVGIRRKIHEYPELSYEEFKTSEVIRAELDKLGISYKHPVAETGVIGYIGTGEPPFVALRADIDGLPIQEMVEWEHKSKVPGKMHACGHDAHTAMVLGAAKILKQHEDQIKGTVVLVFQPAEEGGAGAKRVLESGVLDKVSAIFGLHVAPVRELPVGHVASKAGPLLAGTAMFDATIHGRGGHAAMPHFAIDPVLAASSAVVNLQQLVSREADPLDPQVLTVANFHADGAYNVIPDSVTFGGTIRALLPESIARLKERIHQVITGQAAVHRCTAEVDFHEDKKPLYPATINDDKLHEHFLEVAKKVVGNNNVHGMEPVTVSEDFSFYQEALPGYFFMLGMQSLTGEPLQSLHSPHFTVNEDALPYGAALHASLATTYLLNHDGANKVDFHEDKKPLYPATINDDKLHEHFLEVAKKVVGNNNVHGMEPVTVSEDFSFYQEALPGYFFMLGMQSLTGEPLQSLHSPHFTVNEDALPYGAALHASLATTYLLNHDGANKVGGKYHDEL
ncbi:hypothetical protein Ahy_B09g095085 isoform C [Arachis hypogaea]|uniref:Peptidase M20 dimerisation domain-containing protein n=1 Tax=Arachis hypogaea TaxID=3818 RepID=A0A444XD89_ARAHY|nr:hypothetical protein Ahy_B09g095085 isoform C [Arachis hypogaea]